MFEVTLTIRSPAGTRRLPLAGASATLGRGTGADIVIADDGSLSRRHATVRRDGARVWVLDEGSTNGSFLNGARVPAAGATVADGDELRIGDATVITLEIKPATHDGSDSPAHDAAPAGVAPAEAASNGVAPSADVQSPTALAAPTRASLPPAVLASAIAVAVLLLGGLGFALHSLTRAPSSQAVGVIADAPADARTPDARETEGAATVGEAPNAVGSPSPVAHAVTPPDAQPAPSPASDAAQGIAQGVAPASASSEPSADDERAGPARRRLYKEMSEEEQMAFVKRRAEHVALMMGRRPYAFTPEALRHIKFWLDAFARRAGNKRTGLWSGDTAAILERGSVCAPTIIRAFRERNVPVVIGLYIPFIETEYTNISGENFAGAAGLFQFIGATSEAYGVPRAERTNVEKMAPAAARYFRDNIMKFGDDPMGVALSVAAYNRAPESVMRDLRNVLNAPNNESKERSFWTLVLSEKELDEYFQRENIDYVPRFFAAAIFGETPWAFGIDMRQLSTYTEPAAGAAPRPGTR